MGEIKLRDGFPLDTYISQMVRFLDIIQYNDDLYTRDERIRKMHYAYCKAVHYFAQPYQRRHLKLDLKRLQSYLQSAVNMIVCGWATATDENTAALSIFYIHMIFLDETIDGRIDPAESMTNFHDNLISGKPQDNKWWKMVNADMPQCLQHYGPYCSFNIIRSVMDFFQGNWIEHHKFAGYPGSTCYPAFLRALNGAGHSVGATLFPKERFDENKFFNDITAAIPHIGDWQFFVNDLFSFYKEFDDPNDETFLAKCYARCDETTVEEGFKKLANEVCARSQNIIRVFHDKDVNVWEVVRKFVHGFVTWNFTDSRYHMKELFEIVEPTNEVNRKFLAYMKSASVHILEDSDWAYPLVSELVANVEENVR